MTVILALNGTVRLPGRPCAATGGSSNRLCSRFKGSGVQHDVHILSNICASYRPRTSLIRRQSQSAPRDSPATPPRLPGDIKARY